MIGGGRQQALLRLAHADRIRKLDEVHRLGLDDLFQLVERAQVVVGDADVPHAPGRWSRPWSPRMAVAGPGRGGPGRPAGRPPSTRRGRTSATNRSPGRRRPGTPPAPRSARRVRARPRPRRTSARCQGRSPAAPRRTAESFVSTWCFSLPPGRRRGRVRRTPAPPPERPDPAQRGDAAACSCRAKPNSEGLRWLALY